MAAFKIILPIIQNAMSGAWSYLQGAWDLIVGVFTLNGDRIKTGLLGMWEGINQLLVGWPAKMWQAGMDMVTGLINGIVGSGSKVREVISSLAGGIISQFKGMLGIHSPSRVFAQFGDYTMQGLAGGLDRSASDPLQRVKSLGERMKQAGAGIALTAATAPVMAAGAPLMAAGAAQAAAGHTAPATYEIHIHAQPSSNAQDIAQEVRRQIEAIERERSSRRASRLTD